MTISIILKGLISCWIINAVLGNNEGSEVLLKNSPLNGPKIINGTEADWYGTRHQVSIRLKDRDWFFGGGHICGGSLIAENVVLTAGHCIWNYDLLQLREPHEFSVVMGNLNRFQQDNNTLILNVTSISMLPTFNVSIFRDDIAIMFLNGSVPTNYTRAFPISLNKIHGLRGGTLCEVSGWGRTETGQYPANLMVVDVAIVNRTVCRQSYENYLIDGMICAGYLEGERDACDGDSGGPLTCGDKLVGIVSYGVGCALPNFPGVYAEVAHYVDWINKETGGSGVSLQMPMSLLGILFLSFVLLKNI